MPLVVSFKSNVYAMFGISQYALRTRVTYCALAHFFSPFVISFCTLSLLFAILLYLSLTSSPLFLSLSRFLFAFRPFSLLSRFFSPFLPLFHPARLFASYYYCFLPRILFFALACFILVMLLIMLLSLSTCCHMRTCILSFYRLFFPPPPNSIIFFIFSQIRSFSFPPLSLSFSVFFLLLSLRESSHFLTAE